MSQKCDTGSRTGHFRLFPLVFEGVPRAVVRTECDSQDGCYGVANTLV